MTKTEVKKAIKAELKQGQGFMKLCEVTRFLGKTNPQRIKKKYLYDLESVDGMYLVDDVARVLAERMC